MKKLATVLALLGLAFCSRLCSASIQEAARARLMRLDSGAWGAHRGAYSVFHLRQDKISEYLTFLRTQITVSVPEVLFKTGNMHTVKKHLAVFFSIF